MKIIFLYPILFLFLYACTGTGTRTSNTTSSLPKNTQIEVPSFNEDSAYSYIEKQLNFGFRIPNTKEHQQCANYLTNFFKSLNSNVIVQEANLKAYNNTLLKAKNIIAEFQPNNPNRILLFAHWDTRPFADNSKHKELQNQPIMGADDGASGVAVLMEIARQIAKKQPNIGVDIILFDAEDYGPPQFDQKQYKGDFWCLGSQYWAKNKHKEDYYARYGILLDMVGGEGAIFAQEQYSSHYAQNIVDKVWNTAAKLGYSQYFPFTKGGIVTDDHYYVNTLAGIPSIDIISYNPIHIFPAHWHTENDNIENIDKKTLKAVGQTILEVVYNEK